MLTPPKQTEAMMKKKRVLFLCTGNSCRSHMAEGLLRALDGDDYEAFSAGAKPAGYVHPLAIAAMRDAGVDISSHQSKSLDAFSGQEFTYVITVCDRAREACPVFPGAAKQLHWDFDDPAHAEGSKEQKMAVFRRVREEIKHRVQLFLTSESKQPDGSHEI
jgi:arsenate reductase